MLPLQMGVECDFTRVGKKMVAKDWGQFDISSSGNQRWKCGNVQVHQQNSSFLPNSNILTTMEKKRGNFLGWFSRQLEQQPKNLPFINPKLLKEMLWRFSTLCIPGPMCGSIQWSQLTLASAQSPSSQRQTFGPSSLCIYVVGVMFYIINKAYFQLRRQNINEGAWK